jgi:NAD(P)-dependent dehydrogenase (short-subunit alcohol dehydrogenase family)
VGAELTGKVALVTGVGRAGQIGLAVARGLGRAGARLVIVGRDGAALETHARTLAAEGIDARPAPGDLTDPAAAAAAVAVASTRFGGLDGVAHLAGGLVNFGPIEDTDIAAFDAEIAANLKTAFVMSRAAVPALRARGGGAMVMFASSPRCARRRAWRPTRRPKPASPASPGRSRGSCATTVFASTRSRPGWSAPPSTSRRPARTGRPGGWSSTRSWPPCATS